MNSLLVTATDGITINTLGFCGEDVMMKAIARMIANRTDARVVVQTLYPDQISVLHQGDPRENLCLSPSGEAEYELVVANVGIKVPPGYWLFTVSPDALEPTDNQDTLLMMLHGLCTHHPEICTREVHELVTKDIRSSLQSQLENTTAALRYYGDPTHWNGDTLNPNVYRQANPDAEDTQPHTAAVLALCGLTVPKIAPTQGE